MLRGMEDRRNPHYTPFGKPRPLKSPNIREPLWTLMRDGVEWSAEPVFRGESYGVGARGLNQGELLISRRFTVKEPAVRWADEQKIDIERGWT
jgi:hypothetical protein